MTKYNEEVLKSARELLKYGDTVYTIIRHVSASGMSRDVSAYVIKDNKPIMIDYLLKELLGYSYSKKQGVRIGGCGMDMGYHLVSSLAGVLFGYISPEEERAKGEYTNCYGLNHSWL